MKRILNIFFLFITLSSDTFSQSPNSHLPEPEIGKPCPNFVLNKIDFYKEKKLSLADLKGKWVVLDFWSRGCSGCVASLPRISKEQIEFGDSLKFIMVGPDARPDDRLMYADYHRKLNLTMPSAFDSKLAESFNVGLLPHVIIIDPNGIVRAITNSPTPVKLRELMKGKNPVFQSPSYANKKNSWNDFQYNRDIPFLIAGNGGVDSNFLYRSLLTRWQPGNPGTSINSTRFFYKAKLEFFVKSVEQLYKLAYFGKESFGNDDSTLYGIFFGKPIFEVNDLDIIKPDRATKINLYCYSLKVPTEKANEKYMRQIMQRDLKNYFGYEVSIETREMPYWRLIATEEARINLKTKGGAMTITNGNRPLWSGAMYQNYPMKKLATTVGYYSQVTKDGSPLIDETGITSNVDIDLDWAKGDYEIVRKALQKNGLDLIPGKRKIKCLVIRDPKMEYDLTEIKN